MPTNHRPARAQSRLFTYRHQGNPQQRRPGLVECCEPRILFHFAEQEPIQDITMTVETAPQTIDLRPVAYDENKGTTVRFNFGSLGNIDLQMFDNGAPRSVANFLNTVNTHKYDNTIIHRSEPGRAPNPVPFVIQGGGFQPSGTDISPTGTPTVPNEFNSVRSNLRGTIAYAKLGNDPNSATTEFFVNLNDNSTILDPQNGGFTVFAKVLGNGMSVADAIAALPRVNATNVNPPNTGAWNHLPVTNITSPALTPLDPTTESGPAQTPAQSQMVILNSATVTGSTLVPITYAVTSSDPGLVNPTVSGSTLVLNHSATRAGTATITITATESNNPTPVVSTFDVTVTGNSVPIGDGANAQTIVYTDGDGTIGTVKIKGGSANVQFAGTGITKTVSGTTMTVAGTGLEIAEIALSGSNPSVTITTAGNGDGRVVVNAINSTPAVKSFIGKGVVLKGASKLDNGVGKLDVARTEGATITINRGGEARLQDAAITIGDAVDTDITSQQPIKLLKLNSWGGTDANADTITTPALRGIKATGDYTGDLVLSGNGQAVGKPVLGNVNIGGVLGAGTWTVTGRGTGISAGSVNGWSGHFADLGKLTSRGAIGGATVLADNTLGAVSATSISNSTIFAGVSSAPGALPADASGMSSTGEIRSVTIRNKATTDPTFAASNIAAATVGKLTLGIVNPSNSGTPFGVAAQTIQSLSATAGVGGTPIKASKLSDPSQSIDQTDFKVRVF
jgi:peptidyl-prolyl cis-trans isomerase A (cyclophilin A)